MHPLFVYAESGLKEIAFVSSGCRCCLRADKLESIERCTLTIAIAEEYLKKTVAGICEVADTHFTNLMSHIIVFVFRVARVDKRIVPHNTEMVRHRHSGL